MHEGSSERFRSICLTFKGKLEFNQLTLSHRRRQLLKAKGGGGESTRLIYSIHNSKNISMKKEYFDYGKEWTFLNK